MSELDDIAGAAPLDAYVKARGDPAVALRSYNIRDFTVIDEIGQSGTTQRLNASEC
jgi:hypothetical protein